MNKTANTVNEAVEEELTTNKQWVSACTPIEASTTAGGSALHSGLLHGTIECDLCSAVRRMEHTLHFF